MRTRKPIPVIDIFAGPGGLGEGFSALTDKYQSPIFKLVLSIEKEKFAHQTLELRSFYRQFKKNKVPGDYYEYLRNNISRDELFNKYPEESAKAKREAWLATLGETPESEIDARISESLKGANKWILIGGPPCQAYSLVGRSRNQQKEGLDQNDPRVYLYREYYRILAVHNPPVFVMENVKGLLSSKVNGDLIFQQVLNDLRDPVKAYYKLPGKDGKNLNGLGYNIYSLVRSPRGENPFSGEPDFISNDFVIKCENYGIPQTRHRIILLGIRKDLSITPDILEPQKEKYIHHVIKDLPKLRSGLSKHRDNKKEWKKVLSEFLIKKNLNELDTELIKIISKNLKKISGPKYDRGDEFVPKVPNIKYEKEWFLDEKLKGFCNHSTRAHIDDDLYRYFFAAAYAAQYNHSPKLLEFPRELLPNHNNVSEALEENKFADRFRVQLKHEPARTITSHIAKDGHYYIHYDPLQCRSLTVREAARIQTFPDNYYFCGPRTSQYIQVGNAVPPLLAKTIAGIIAELFEG